MEEEHYLGVTVVGSGGRTSVPKRVMELLDLRYSPRFRQKILWTVAGGEVVAKKGTPESSFRKSILSRGGKTAIPKHIREALKLKSTPEGLERVVWIRVGRDVIVRREPPDSRKRAQSSLLT